MQSFNIMANLQSISLHLYHTAKVNVSNIIIMNNQSAFNLLLKMQIDCCSTEHTWRVFFRVFVQMPSDNIIQNGITKKL